MRDSLNRRERLDRLARWMGWEPRDLEPDGAGVRYYSLARGWEFTLWPDGKTKGWSPLEIDADALHLLGRYLELANTDHYWELSGAFEYYRCSLCRFDTETDRGRGAGRTMAAAIVEAIEALIERG